METHTIQAELRTDVGKGVARKLRALGKIPAVAYGVGSVPVGLAVEAKEFRTLKKAPLGWNTPVNIAIEGGDDITLAVLKAVQKHPVNGELLHADFQLLAAGAEVTVRVPVTTSGKAVGAALGGSIQCPLRQIDLICAPENIPAVVNVDVTPFGIGDKMMLQDLPLPDGCRVASRHNPPVVACVGKRGARIEEDAAPGEAADEEGVAEE